MARPGGQCHGRADRRQGPITTRPLAGAVAFRRRPRMPGARRRAARPGRARAQHVLTSGRGQRMGIFAGSGVGKSVMLSMLARNAGRRDGDRADRRTRSRGAGVHRGRSWRSGLARSVVVVATSDQPALMRRQAAFSRSRSPSTSATRARTCWLWWTWSRASPWPSARSDFGGRTADHQGLYADRVRRAAAAPRARRAAARGMAPSPASSPCWSTATTTTSRWPTRCASSSTAIS